MPDTVLPTWFPELKVRITFRNSPVNLAQLQSSVRRSLDFVSDEFMVGKVGFVVLDVRIGGRHICLVGVDWFLLFTLCGAGSRARWTGVCGGGTGIRLALRVQHSVG